MPDISFVTFNKSWQWAVRTSGMLMNFCDHLGEWVLQNERILESRRFCSFGQLSPIASTSTNLNLKIFSAIKLICWYIGLITSQKKYNTFPSWAEWVCCPADRAKAPRARGSKPASNFISNFFMRFEGNCDWFWNVDHIKLLPCIGWSWSFQVLGKSGWSGTSGWLEFCNHKGDFDGFYLSRQERVRSLWRMLMLSKEGKICKITCYMMFWSS